MPRTHACHDRARQGCPASALSSSAWALRARLRRWHRASAGGLRLSVDGALFGNGDAPHCVPGTSKAAARWWTWPPGDELPDVRGGTPRTRPSATADHRPAPRFAGWAGGRVSVAERRANAGSNGVKTTGDHNGNASETAGALGAAVFVAPKMGADWRQLDLLVGNARRRSGPRAAAGRMGSSNVDGASGSEFIGSGVRRLAAGPAHLGRRCRAGPRPAPTAALAVSVGGTAAWSAALTSTSLSLSRSPSDFSASVGPLLSREGAMLRVGSSCWRRSMARAHSAKLLDVGALDTRLSRPDAPPEPPLESQTAASRSGSPGPGWW